MEYTIKKLPFDPTKIKGMSEKLLVSHHENNYSGAVKRLNAITAQLAGLDFATAPVFVVNGLKREELIATNSMIIHELYFDSLVVTKLDVLDELEKVPVCVAYRAGKNRVSEIPATVKGLEGLEPVYECLPGWQTPTTGISTFEQLPARAQEYIRYLETQTGVEVGCISTGPERNETILRPGSRFEKLVS